VIIASFLSVASRTCKHSEHAKIIHLANAISNNESRFICKTAKTVEEAKELIEQGFEYVTEIDGVKLFRKTK